jgi:hypothetical protein
MSTGVYTYTYTETATYLSGLIMGAISDLLAALGIDRSSLYSDWEQDESAICAWIAEQSLSKVVLECVQPGGTVAPIFEFPIRYDSGRGRFVERQAAMARYRAKLESVPTKTSFRLFCTFRATRTPQRGWGPGTRASTNGLRSRSLGTLGEGPHAAADLTMYR